MNTLDIFMKESPQVAEAFHGLIAALRDTRGMDAKTQQLIYIALKASEGDATAIHYHVPMAKNAGASRDEVKDAILITLTVGGLKGVASCLPTALEAYDNC
jgi:alkylhydroperoxidase/carboxymuconolactone decarboxylase family protein YurZ